MKNVLHSPSHESQDQADEEDDHKDCEEDLGYRRSPGGDTAETEDGSDNSHNKEDQSPPQHFTYLLFGKFSVCFLQNIV
jgi:hypothetical protein